jgi:hypothetical protein
VAGAKVKTESEGASAMAGGAGNIQVPFTMIAQRAAFVPKGVAKRTKQEHTMIYRGFETREGTMLDDFRETLQDLAALGSLVLLGATMLIWSDVLVELARV